MHRWGSQGGFWNHEQEWTTKSRVGSYGLVPKLGVFHGGGRVDRFGGRRVRVPCEVHRGEAGRRALGVVRGDGGRRGRLTCRSAKSRGSLHT